MAISKPQFTSIKIDELYRDTVDTLSPHWKEVATDLKVPSELIQHLVSSSGESDRDKLLWVIDNWAQPESQPNIELFHTAVRNQSASLAEKMTPKILLEKYTVRDRVKATDELVQIGHDKKQDSIDDDPFIMASKRSDLIQSFINAGVPESQTEALLNAVISAADNKFNAEVNNAIKLKEPDAKHSSSDTQLTVVGKSFDELYQDLITLGLTENQSKQIVQEIMDAGNKIIEAALPKEEQSEQPSDTTPISHPVSGYMPKIVNRVESFRLPQAVAEDETTKAFPSFVGKASFVDLVHMPKEEMRKIGCLISEKWLHVGFKFNLSKDKLIEISLNTAFEFVPNQACVENILLEIKDNNPSMSLARFTKSLDECLRSADVPSDVRTQVYMHYRNIAQKLFW
ncbi:hypothetical protein D5018_04255 [Parashewanella curva]|uniref:Death domain-containing protein n=1 Tax=Parashewanella curva TaxID=2338552 RepID=A0A3L8Q0T1_9GAMM|nr:hypothetical protein [Parashewanella curva]RLV61060.1 hypothetical protein D5018_04255 [Parashewanella curva]